MDKAQFKRCSKSVSFLVFFPLLILFQSRSLAQVSNVDNKDRFRVCNPQGGEGIAGQQVTVEGLVALNPLNGSGDAELETDNPVCSGIVLGTYAGVKAGISVMNAVCGSGSKIPRVTPSLILDIKDLSVGHYKATSNPGNTSCVASVAFVDFNFVALVTEIAVIYEIAKDTYKKARICGSNWKRWNNVTMNKDIPYRLGEVEEWVEKAKDKEKNPELNALLDVTLENGSKEFREWVYGGVEKEDTGGCLDVTRKVNGKYPPQRYYMRGSEPGNFNCGKYKIKSEMNDPTGGGRITAERAKEYNEAYKCCAARSRNSICIENGSDYKFCEAGSRCWVGIIEFQTQFKIPDRLICASTYSLCPYNFNIGGGTTDCDNYRDGIFDQDGVFVPIKYGDIKNGNCDGKSEIRNADCKPNGKAGKCKNYCQMFNHCVAVSSVNFYQSSISSPYFSSACIDFEGDSRNNLEYDMSVLSGSFRINQRNFTAPIAQCVRETMENIFYNRAGHSLCTKAYEVPDKDGRCNSDLYQYKKGEDVSKYKSEYRSVFSEVQKRVRDIIKVILTLAVTLMGFKILLGGQNLKQPEIIIFLVKMGFVVYFATGNAWQTSFFDGIYKASDTISSAVINLGMTSDQSKWDGCQFGRVRVTDVSGSSQSVDVTTYPPGKGYLAIWDTLDCKIARYLGYGPEVDVANIAILIFAGFFTGPIGIYFSLLLMVFGFFMISAAIRALHIFLLSSMSIILLVFLSPIVIPSILFKKTSSIFNNWLNNLIGFILQPIILFAYIGIFILVMDKIVIGSASFTGSSPNKIIVCDKYCLDKRTGGTIPLAQDVIDKECRSSLGRKLINPNQDSVGCILNFNNTTSFPGFEVVGIGLTLLTDIFKDGGREKIITFAKAALVLYVLDLFMSEIPAIASNLVGASKLVPDGPSARDIFGKTLSIVGGMQKRANRAIKKVGKGSSDRSKSAARSLGQNNSQGKSAEKDSSSSGGSRSGDTVG